jgi:N-acetylneuraminic acid mutarotase
MLTESRHAILFGLCLVLASCDGTRPDPTGPAEESSALDAATLTASNTWEVRRQAPFPAGGRAGTFNGIIYVVGGVNAWGGPRPTLAYNISTNTWTNRQPLPIAAPRAGFTGVTPIKGKLYVAGGRSSSGPRKTLYVYDPATNTWARRADLPQPASCGSQGEIGGLLYVYAGCTDVIEPADPLPGSHQLFRYNPATNRWVTLTPPRIRHDGGFGAALGNRFYVGGGWWDNAPTGFVHAYDPATNTWTDRASVPHPGGHLFGAFNVLGGKLYVAGGWDDSGLNTNHLNVYDPVANTWTTKAPMPTERAASAAAGGGGRFFVIGGQSGHPDSPPETVDGSRRVDAYTP